MPCPDAGKLSSPGAAAKDVEVRDKVPPACLQLGVRRPHLPRRKNKVDTVVDPTRSN